MQFTCKIDHRFIQADGRPCRTWTSTDGRVSVFQSFWGWVAEWQDDEADTFRTARYATLREAMEAAMLPEPVDTFEPGRCCTCDICDEVINGAPIRAVNDDMPVAVCLSCWDYVQGDCA